MIDNSLISPIRISSLADTVTERIRKAIILGDLKPGERLAEPALSAMLGVSRSPVREALQILKGEGLVVEQANRSNVVWNPSLVDVAEIFSLRSRLEILATEWCIEKLNDADFAVLEAIIARQRAALEAQDLFTLIDLDREFHEAVLIRANHHRLLIWWQQLMWQWEVLVYFRIKRQHSIRYTSQILSDHQDILQGLRRRDLARLTEIHRSINARVEIETCEILLNELSQAVQA